MILQENKKEVIDEFSLFPLCGDDSSGMICGRFQTFVYSLYVGMILILNRYELNISATQIRQYMLEDNRKEWMKWVNPRLHKMYDELRRELLTVPYYKELAKGV